MKKLQRRTMLQLLGAGVLCTSLPSFAFASKAQKTVKVTRFILGTVASIEVRSDSEEKSREAIEKAFLKAESERLIFDRHSQNTALYVLNETGNLNDVPHQLQLVLNMAQQYERVTRGLFNPTVLPYVECIEATHASQKNWEKAKKTVGSSQAIVCDAKKILLPSQEMKLTLDGIAKGYIIDQMAHVFAQESIAHYIVNVGGDIRVQGLQENGEPWKIGIRMPQKFSQELVASTTLRSGALATSGVYERNALHDTKKSHLVHPLTGKSPQFVLSASVKAADALTADALATAIMFMQPHDAIRFIEKQPNAACMLVHKTGVLQSSRWNV